MKKLFLFTALALFTCIQSWTQTLPPGFSATSIGSGWVSPVGAAFTSNGQRLFVWEKGGRVYVCNRNGSGNYIKQANPVLNISEEVGDWRDHGMLGFALDPQFLNNGYIYLLYVVDRHHLVHFGTPNYNAAINQYYAATIGRVTRYQTMTNGSGELVANTATRSILIGETRSTGIPILHESHGVGGLAFAADGMLLITAGDGASYNGVDQGSRSDTYFQVGLDSGIIRANENVGAFRSQLINCHNGKLLRIDPATGNGVGSNPFFSAAEPRAPKSRVWAMGFRNPFRVAVKPGTGSTNPSTGDIGEVFVGDVGWNLWEEMNIITEAGMNCGWPLYEGHGTMSSYFTLNRVNPDQPNPLFGAGGCTQQFFTFNNLLKQATADNNTTVYNPCNAATVIGNHNRHFHRRPGVDWRHGQDVARVGIFNGNTAEVDTIGKPNSTVGGPAFRGNCAVGGTWYNGDAFPAEYKNTFFQGDLGGQWLKRVTINFTDVVTRVDIFGSGFSNLVCIAQNPLDGSIVTVEITATGVKKIAYGGNMLPVVKMTSNKTYGPSALNVAFNGSGSYDPNGTIAAYSWNFGDPGSGVNNTSTLANPSHTFTVPGGTPKKFFVKLTVTDNGGASSTDSILISVNNTPPVVNITSPVKNSQYTIGADTLYTCSATVTDAEHSSGQLQYAWQTILRHNNHQHPESIDTARNTNTMISRIGCNGDSYYWLIELTVTDAAGLSTKDSSTIYPNCSGPLPLVLRSFSVTQQGAVNLVKWVTENAMQIESFEVERSTDGVNFFILDRQDARNTFAIHGYSFSDNGFSPGTNYYRLKMSEIGNVIKYSVIIKVSSEIKREELVISPNPVVVGNFSIKYNSIKNGSVVIRISDISGRQVQTIRRNVNRGQNIIYIQSMSTWTPGMYLVTVEQENDIQQGKLIKAE